MAVVVLKEFGVFSDWRHPEEHIQFLVFFGAYGFPLTLAFIFSTKTLLAFVMFLVCPFLLPSRRIPLKVIDETRHVEVAYKDRNFDLLR